MTDLLKVDLGVDLVEAKLSTEREDYPLYRLGGNDIPKEGRAAHTLYAGDEIGGEFIGTKPMFSTEPKENWDEATVEGRKIWTNKHYVFRQADGSLVGLFASSTLWKLQKIATAATHPAIKNPLVKISYVGLIEGKDRLKSEFGIEIKSGNKAHVCRIAHSKDARVSETVAGCVNLTQSPRPTFGKASDLTSFEQDVANFEKMAQYSANNAEAPAQLSM